MEDSISEPDHVKTSFLPFPLPSRPLPFLGGSQLEAEAEISAWP
jgi:hypothetical protein